MTDKHKSPIEREEFINILYDIVKKYDGHHEKHQVCNALTKSEEFKNLEKFIKKHYVETDFIESCLV
jgi:hypothetical protein